MQNVFVAGNVYFTDADCYARMTRVRICAEHPGQWCVITISKIFPSGTTPHTTAPLDYLILLLALLLKPFTAQPSTWPERSSRRCSRRLQLVSVVVVAPHEIAISAG